ncbi:MAG: acyl carrier protein [Erysipelotrichaceae bacterium]|nr:acyl carrier protein [Erysipelotrichaceae bacterium]MBR3252372.1 acyl carrier protein [Erysipelotrichaceae bacterium]
MFEEVLKQLQDLIRDYTGNSELVINEDTMMVKDLELSSLDVINLMGSIEDTFDISIEDEDLANLLTVKDVVDYIISKKED